MSSSKRRVRASKRINSSGDVSIDYSSKGSESVNASFIEKNPYENSFDDSKFTSPNHSRKRDSFKEFFHQHSASAKSNGNHKGIEINSRSSDLMSKKQKDIRISGVTDDGDEVIPFASIKKKSIKDKGEKLAKRVSQLRTKSNKYSPVKEKEESPKTESRIRFNTETKPKTDSHEMLLPANLKTNQKMRQSIMNL